MSDMSERMSISIRVDKEAKEKAIPTKETLKALDELERKDGETFNNIDELFESLED